LITCWHCCCVCTSRSGRALKWSLRREWQCWMPRPSLLMNSDHKAS